MRRSGVIALVVLWAVPLSACESRAPHDDPGAPRLFAPDSVWNARLPRDAPVDPTSAARSGALLREVRAEIRNGTGPWISEREYSTPIYTVRADQPRVPVTLDTGSWGDPLRRALEEGVPIPSDARPARGTDAHLVVHQPATDRMWEFWRASKQADGWHAAWGGAIARASRHPGYYTNRTWEGLRSPEGFNWGSTASSLPVAAGTILIDELRRGTVPHALAMAMPEPCQGYFSWPAQRTDGGSTAPDCLPEGAHLRIDPEVDLDALDMPRITRVLAEAAQEYGMIVRDRSGAAVGFYAEDPAPLGTDPYRGPDGLYGGLAPWDFLPQFPWKHVQLLRMHVCTAAPCLPD